MMLWAVFTCASASVSSSPGPRLPSRHGLPHEGVAGAATPQRPIPAYRSRGGRPRTVQWWIRCGSSLVFFGGPGLLSVRVTGNQTPAIHDVSGPDGVRGPHRNVRRRLQVGALWAENTIMSIRLQPIHQGWLTNNQDCTLLEVFTVQLSRRSRAWRW